MYTSLRNAYREESVACKSAFYCENKSACDVKAMYRVTNEITGRKQPPVLPECSDSHEDLAERFRVYFSEKIMNIRSTMHCRDAQLSILVNECPSKCCALDPWPTTLLKTNIDIFAPVLAAIINVSLGSATVPAEMMHALVMPLLKKTGLDANDINNYRPISNLSFVTKLLERHVAADLRRYIDETKLLDPFRSAYRPHHSTETALVRIHGDIMQALDRRKGVILVLLDLTAAFDTVDHAILLQQMKSIGICESALAWVTSYLSDRTVSIKINDAISRRQQLNCGVPHGSVLGPLLFTIYCMSPTAIFAKHHLKYHMYGDDTQL